MKFVHKISIVNVVFATLLADINSFTAFGHDSNIGLLNYMTRSNDFLKQDPARSLDCFNKYLPLINEIANSYETNFTACLNESEAANVKADGATLEQRNDLTNAAEASCSLLKQCHENKSAGDVFQCYINEGSSSLQTMYIINANASQDLAALRQQYYLIQNEEYKCTNETKRIYEKESAEAYAALNICILGNSDMVTEKPTISTKTTTVETTKGPQTSKRPATARGQSTEATKQPQTST